MVLGSIPRKWVCFAPLGPWEPSQSGEEMETTVEYGDFLVSAQNFFPKNWDRYQNSASNRMFFCYFPPRMLTLCYQYTKGGALEKTIFTDM
jgi:hypothetical protein